MRKYVIIKVSVNGPNCVHPEKIEEIVDDVSCENVALGKVNELNEKREPNVNYHYEYHHYGYVLCKLALQNYEINAYR